MPGYRNRIFILVYLFLHIIGILGGCRRTLSSRAIAEKEIKHLLALREQAIENKDINLYMACISLNYKDKTDTHAKIKEKMLKNFSSFEKIDFSQFDQAIYHKNDMAMIVQNYELVFTIKGRSDYVKGKEKIFLRRKNGQWKIVKGL